MKYSKKTHFFFCSEETKTKMRAAFCLAFCAAVACCMAADVANNTAARNGAGEEARNIADVANPYNYQVSHVGSYPLLVASRSLYNVDASDNDVVVAAAAAAPLLPAAQQQSYSREVSIEQQPAARSSSPYAAATTVYEPAPYAGLGDACASKICSCSLADRLRFSCMSNVFFVENTAEYDCAHIKTNAHCSGGVCACGFDTAQLANLACLARAKHLGDKCVLSEQCKNIDPLATCYVSKKVFYESR